MKTPRALFISASLTGAIALALALTAQAQTATTSGEIVAPDYSSVSSSGLPNRSFNTPESDGRPGAKFFAYGVQAVRKGDYRHAIDMYKVAASWAYKPAEYNLAIMYYKGQGVPVNRPLGAAWMVLAAERGDPRYVRARDLMVTVLTKSQFEETDKFWDELKQTYGDKVAQRRAKARWAQVKADTTGSRVGAAASEYLMVGGSASEAAPRTHGSNLSMHTIGVPVDVTGWGVFKGAAITDGSVAYQQFQQSDNPYSPIFLKNRTGTITVEPLQPVKPGKHSPNQKPAPASSPQQPPRNA
ncbi:MAG: tetratricopeptide repeat protein [Rhodanobacteraceae bacterium]